MRHIRAVDFADGSGCLEHSMPGVASLQVVASVAEDGSMEE